jgi:serine/threonine protein kinase
MEYVDGGPIMRLGPGCTGLDEDLARTYFRDIIAGLEYCMYS